MTDLQMGLIALGVAAVLGVLAYNKWQEHKHRKLAEALLSARQADVLLDESAALVDDAAGVAERPGLERVEPLLHPQGGSKAGPAMRPAAADDAEALPAGERTARPTRADEERPAVKAGTVPLYLLSPAIDYIAAIEVSEPAAAYQIREAQRAALARLGKPLHWIGFNEQEHAWEAILEDTDSAYQHIRIGLQLVDRQGPVRDGDLSIFHLAMQDLATELMGFAELPLREPALQAAAQLDEFCAGVDIQIGVNVISQGQVFPGTKLRALAESAGMTIDPEGRFARFDDEGKLLFVLINQETQGFSAESMRTMTTHGVTFLLDVPRVANGDRVLIQMVELARRFADSLHGALVDDNRRPLSEGGIEPIRRQVVQYQTAMATRQLPAGGALALRLFS
ncbi:MAG: cell division protein ZipA C-terminal FtsZ-binding domain-containing protein [Candidatus Accumulibacter phosphatis]|uniref:Cell division protein ZipA n=1 Tax=Candidatus Accumulibacter contiguus TaxID=2954381 RepID=A0ABX1T867_9PROT|nr:MULTISPECIES: cell division protein ZipA C-terminal FtsZ-binding domain-containing protein [Candidatus Accumulibacter]MBL8409017.1 cell division protein ZipA C-terminal FtsZ-binding domain-containing protein [Accumulibacter sp.]NMQ05845.1 cell division protein FtsZ [Candidatus Accumulibacter contiguus]HRF13475.1 cell division protein ZipA C-terminal FtsZ-binding domain-containing protein [Candidatus Accumulibacter phosphatis]